MSFKKNAFSYFVWIIFVMCNLVVFSFLSLLCAKVLGGPMPVVALGLAAAFFGLLFLIFFLTGYLNRKVLTIGKLVEKEKNVRGRLIAEGIFAVCLLAAGVCLRIYLLPTAGETAAYFDVAKVSQDNGAMLVPVQNSVYYYLCLLHGVFLLFGNHWIAGIWVQIILQVLASLVMYFIVRKTAGVWVSLVTLSYLMFVPSAVRSSLLYAPDMLYLLIWSVGLLLVVLYLNAGRKETGRAIAGYNIWMWFAAVFIGLLTGFLTYVDVTGIALLIPLFMLPMVLRDCSRKVVWTLRMFLAVISAVGGFLGSMFLDGLFSGISFQRVLNAWGLTFSPDVPDMILLMQNSTIEVMILLVCMAVNVFSFLRRKDRDIITLWMLMTFVLAGLYVMGFTTVSMNGRPLLLLLMCVSGAVSLRELFQTASVKQAKESTADIEVVVDTEESVSVNEPIPKPRFIENPLPLPKKHVKRTMDYAFVPEVAQMNYDIEITENDDFDV